MQRGRLTATPRRRPPPEGLFCNYNHRVCMQNRVEGYDFCLRHILEDKTSPYRQCNYTSTRTGKRCVNAAPKADKKEGYCPEHSKLMMAYRYKMCQRQRPRESAESLIHDLSQYAKKKDVVDEAKDKDSKGKVATQGVASTALDYGSSDESEGESVQVEKTWCGEVESDAESVDSEQEDLLKHAGVYTSEEVALIMRDKLIRLQSLYIEQFKRLQHVMKERRRKYLQAARQDRELVPLTHYKKDVKSRKNYFKLLALRKYHRRHGKEAWLHRQSKERRIAVSESFNYRPPLFARCIDMTSGVKCTTRVLPLSKYCLKHIISDHNQILYHPCTFSECTRPVLDTTTDPLCVYHTCLLPPPLVPEVQPSAAVEAPTEPTEVPMESLLDPMDLDHMTWNVSDSSLSSTISRLTSCLGPLATLPGQIGELETSLDNSADEQPIITS